MKITKNTMHKFILNRNTLGKRFKECWNDINKICQDNSLLYSTMWTDNVDETKAIIKDTENYNSAVFYGIGGDGTIHNLINTVNIRKYPIQIIPYGTCNDAYRHFYENTPFDLKDFILNNNLETFDLGSANGEYFINSVGINLEGNIIKNYNELFKTKKWLLSSWKYYLSIIYTILKNYKDILVVFDFEYIKKNVLLINISNAPYEGGGIKLSPHATPTDGLLNVIFAQDMTTIKTLFLLSKIKSGQHLNSKNICKYNRIDLHIDSPNEFLYQIDGELRTDSKVALKVHPMSLTLKGISHK